MGYKIPADVETDHTPDELYFMGLYDGLFRFEEIENEADVVDREDDIWEAFETAMQGEWEFPE